MNWKVFGGVLTMVLFGIISWQVGFHLWETLGTLPVILNFSLSVCLGMSIVTFIWGFLLAFMDVVDDT